MKSTDILRIGLFGSLVVSLICGLTTLIYFFSGHPYLCLVFAIATGGGIWGLYSNQVGMLAAKKIEGKLDKESSGAGISATPQ